ncbi:MAG: prolyl oligopeptidase family serine peptidase [Acidimicrobiales bacterium]
MTEAPYGAWRSPITAELVVRAAAGLGDVQIAPDGALVWSETRPEDGGRSVLVRRGPDGAATDLLAPPHSARTRVHEYGGGAWWVCGDALVFAEWSDQRLYRLDPGEAPVAITPDPPVAHGWRYADGAVTPDATWVICVRESHCETDGTPRDEARNEIVAVPATGEGDPVVLVSGPDFVAAPRLSPDGFEVVWLAWDHPRMPWDGTELWRGSLDRSGPHPAVADPRRVAGGLDESLVQPEFTADGRLLVVSDRSDWWNLYEVDDVDSLVPLAPGDAEVATPPWVFGQSRFVERPDGSFVMALSADGLDRLAIATDDGGLVTVELPYTALSSLRATPDGVVAIAASPTEEPAVVHIDLTDPSSPVVTVVRPGRDLGLAPEWFSEPRSVSFPSSGGRTAHALFYPPANPDHSAPPGELPPLLVQIHGGPTSAARPQLALAKQFWTSRGIAVVDVNYGGSTGYGRAFRRQLDGAWGVVDVDDCVAAAEHLAAAGLADPARLLIAGGSAGGFTTLAALAFRDTFAAGASHYGVADLTALAADTHKFESRYLDGLVGPLPDAAELYRERSPIHHLDGFDRPLIVFQGTEDEIVPPNQSEAIVSALEDTGVPVAYVAFEGEQHGFRQAPNIMRALEAQLWFFGAMVGFDPADDIDPVEVRGG